MKTNQSILFFTLLVSLTISYSQTNENKNQLEFSIGSNIGALKNLEFAPVTQYNYNGLVYNLNYQRIKKSENIFNIDFSYLSSEIKTDLTSKLNADYSKIGLGFSYLRKIYKRNSYLIHVGLQSQSNFSNYNSANTNYNYFVLHQEFGLASQFKYLINEKHYLTSKITIPFMLFRITDADAYIKSFGNYQSISWNLKYGYRLTEHFDLNASYNFNYNRLQVPSAYREVQHQINLGISYKF